jgi:hypothetical protein
MIGMTATPTVGSVIAGLSLQEKAALLSGADFWRTKPVERHGCCDEWGFDGLVVSDWGAVDDRIAAVAAGMDLEMPGSNGITDAQIVAAVRAGTLDERYVDESAGRVLALIRKTQAGVDISVTGLDVDAHHGLAREAAGRSIVLLKIEGGILPLAKDANIAVMLFRDVNPSAKLTETVPLRLADTPAYLDFPGEFAHVRYGEGLFVGYRWYDARDLDVAYPVGHGLSYTTFEYGPVAAAVDDQRDIDVRVAGREIVQVYTSLRGSAVTRAPREVTLTLRRKELAYCDIRVDGWVVEGGAYLVDVAASSRDVRSSVAVQVDGDQVTIPLSRASSIGEVMADPVAGPMLHSAIASMMQGLGGAAAIMPEGVDITRMLDSFPIGRIGMFAAGSGTGVDPAMIDALIEAGNRQTTRTPASPRSSSTL